MCHVLNVDLSHVECKNGWVVGYKVIKVCEDGLYKSPFTEVRYNVVQLSDGILIYDVETKPHQAVIMLGRPVQRSIEIDVTPGLHAFLRTCAQYRHQPQECRWVVAARREWICFCTPHDFSARRLICAKDKTKLWRSVEDYEKRMEEIWSFTCECVRKKPKDQYCVVGSGDSASVASYNLLCAVAESGLSCEELDCFREALRKCEYGKMDLKGGGHKYYVVARSRLWAP